MGFIYHALSGRQAAGLMPCFPSDKWWPTEGLLEAVLLVLMGGWHHTVGWCRAEPPPWGTIPTHCLRITAPPAPSPHRQHAALQLSASYSIERGEKNPIPLMLDCFSDCLALTRTGLCAHSSPLIASPAHCSCACRPYFSCSPYSPKWFIALLPLPKIKHGHFLAAPALAAASTTHYCSPCFSEAPITCLPRASSSMLQ